MSSKRNQQPGIFYVSRDKLCPSSLLEDSSECKLPSTYGYESSISVVYNKTHLETKKYDCGCIVYANQYYPYFKYPEVVWLDFFHYTVSPGDKLVKFTVNKCKKKQ